MKETPLVSIVITCSNQEKYILQAIKSAIEQSYPHKEIVVVDDGSTDQSWKKINKISYPLKKFHFSTSHSAAFARNRGMEKTSGEFLLCLDGDDYLMRDYLSKTVPFILRSPQVGLVYTDSYLHNEAQKTLSPRRFRPYCRDLHLKFNFIPSASLFRRDLAFKTGMQDESLSIIEDYDFWLKITSQSFAYYCPEMLYVYRIHGHNKSLADKGLRKKTTEKIAARYRKEIPVLLRIDNQPAVYEVRYGKKILLSTRKVFETLRYRWEHVVSVDPRLFSLYPCGGRI